MKPAAVFGIVLIILGVAWLAYQGFTYTTKEKVVDIGPIEIHDKDKHHVPLPPIVGGAMIVGGVVLVVMGGKKR